MKEASFDRFFVEKDDFEKYKELEKDPSFSINQHPELFLLAACIGYKYDLGDPLICKEGLTMKTSVLNLEMGASIYQAFKIITMEKNEIDENGNLKVNTVIEEYANGGFKKLYNEFLNLPNNRDEGLINKILLEIG